MSESDRGYETPAEHRQGKLIISMGRAARYLDQLHMPKLPPNIHSAEDIVDVLENGDFEDALPRPFGTSVLVLNGSGSLSPFSTFREDNIYKVGKKLRGTQNTVPKNTAAMVSASTYSSEQGIIYRLKLGLEGQIFGFKIDDNTPADSTPEIAAAGLFAYINSDEKALQESDRLLATVYEQSAIARLESQQRWSENEPMITDLLKQGLTKTSQETVDKN